MIRVRFAPSPTGYLHIGGARTCLFNWLFARRHQGKFVLRIEDTDQARSKNEFLEEILDSLKWLGLDWDELYFQSQRFEIYRQYAKKLLDAGLAYNAEDGSGAIIFKVPKKTVRIADLIHGPIQFDTGLLKDQVLIKSDQSPTYNFACVIDDAQMGITHIIRGDDHISNTPKQVVLYEALGFSLPQFAHIPMILGEGGGRMSKRAGATAITEYRRMGFLAPALVNYLMLLGWSPGNNQEIIALKEAAQKFDLSGANKTAAAFNLDKLLWLNSQYIKNYAASELLDLLRPFLEEELPVRPDNLDSNFLLCVLKLFQPRAATLKELCGALKPFTQENAEYESHAAQKYLSEDLSRQFAALKDSFLGLEDFTAQKIEEVFRAVAGKLGSSTKQLIHPLRVALSGRTVGPGMFELVEALGKERTCKRIEDAIEYFARKELRA